MQGCSLLHSKCFSGSDVFRLIKAMKVGRVRRLHFLLQVSFDSIEVCHRHRSLSRSGGTQGLFQVVTIAAEAAALISKGSV